jgi:hypothetical protein
MIAESCFSYNKNLQFFFTLFFRQSAKIKPQDRPLFPLPWLIVDTEVLEKLFFAVLIVIIMLFHSGIYPRQGEIRSYNNLCRLNKHGSLIILS